jgi:hypothetical protein
MTDKVNFDEVLPGDIVTIRARVVSKMDNRFCVESSKDSNRMMIHADTVIKHEIAVNPGYSVYMKGHGRIQPYNVVFVDGTDVWLKTKFGESKFAKIENLCRAVAIAKKKPKLYDDDEETDD